MTEAAEYGAFEYGDAEYGDLYPSGKSESLYVFAPTIDEAQYTVYQTFVTYEAAAQTPVPIIDIVTVDHSPYSWGSPHPWGAARRVWGQAASIAAVPNESYDAGVTVIPLQEFTLDHS